MLWFGIAQHLIILAGFTLIQSYSMEQNFEPFLPFRQVDPCIDDDIWLPFPPLRDNPFQDHVDRYRKLFSPLRCARAVEHLSSDAFKFLVLKYRPTDTSRSKVWDIHLLDHTPSADLNQYIFNFLRLYFYPAYKGQAE